MSEKNLQILELDGRVSVGHYYISYILAIMGNLESNKTPIISLRRL